MHENTNSAMASNPTIAGLPVPGMRTIINLMIGGAIGLAIWEVWARVLTRAVLGYPLEPAGLIDAILNHQFGVSIPPLPREALHYAVGIIGYPVAYYVLKSLLRQRLGIILDAVTLLWFSLACLMHVRAGTGTPLMFMFWSVVLMLVLSRFLNRSALAAEAISWGNFTWVNALAIMAPMGGLSSFLLGEGGDLSYMSFAGHVIYGAVAVLIFEWREVRG